MEVGPEVIVLGVGVGPGIPVGVGVGVGPGKLAQVVLVGLRGLRQYFCTPVSKQNKSLWQLAFDPQVPLQLLGAPGVGVGVGVGVGSAVGVGVGSGEVVGVGDGLVKTVKPTVHKLPTGVGVGTGSSALGRLAGAVGATGLSRFWYKNNAVITEITARITVATIITTGLTLGNLKLNCGNLIPPVGLIIVICGSFMVKWVLP